MAIPLIPLAIGAIGANLLGRLTPPKTFVPTGGFAKTYVDVGGSGVADSIDNIAASGYANVNITENDINRYGIFNGLHIQNNSGENIRVYLDGVYSNKFIDCPAASSASQANLRFTTLTVQNLTAAEPEDNEISITVMKHVDQV